jgi:glutathione S-transferase
MPKLELTYFDFHGGRGEVARLAMAIGSVPFDDHRIPVASWSDMRDKTPLHAVPLLKVDGEVITQSNSINRYVGKLAGLYPEDPLEALRCDEVMDAAEDVMTRIVATFGMDGEELRAARTALVNGPISLYLTRLNEMLAERGGEYFAAKRLTVADLKIFVWVRSLRTGHLDHIPTDLTDRVAPGLLAHCDRIAKLPAIRAYYENFPSS